MTTRPIAPPQPPPARPTAPPLTNSSCRIAPPLLLPVSLFLASLLLAAWPGPAPAGAPSGTREMPGQLVDVQVKVNGRATPLFTARGRSDRRYFEAIKGRNYAIAIRNTTGERVGVLITVDGLNVVDGLASKLGYNEAMYVLDPWESTEIRGWRTSLDEVRRFVFVDEERSYAERTGQANGDLGWIRVATFREVEGRRLRAPGEFGSREGRSENGAGNAPAPSSGDVLAESSRPSSKSSAGHDVAEQRQRHDADESHPGTGWGDRSRDVVRRTTFHPQNSATDHLLLRYEYAAGLHALGIDTRPHRDRLRERENSDLGFARPPKR